MGAVKAELERCFIAPIKQRAYLPPDAVPTAHRRQWAEESAPAAPLPYRPAAQATQWLMPMLGW